MSEWPLRRIDDIAEFLNARRVPVKASDREKRQGSFPYYGASGIVDYVDNFIFNGKYLLISEDGENLRSRNTPIAFLAEGKFWVNNHAHILDEKEPGILDYLSRALNQTDLSPYITGAAQPKLNKRTLSEIEIPIPGIDDRLAINAVLGALDDKIELNRKTAAVLEEMARALYRSWFVDFDPVWAKAEGRPPAHMDPATAALFPDGFDDAGLPLGWRMGCVSDCALKIQNGGTPSRSNPEFWIDGTIPWLTSGEVRQSMIIETTNSISEKGLIGSSAKIVPKGASLVALYGATAGQVSRTAIDLTTNQAVCAVVANFGYENYLFLTLKSEVENLADKAVGSAQQNISKGIVESMSLLIPTVVVASAFQEITAPLFDKIVSCLQENQTLATLRDSLLPRLMSGELRVGAARAMLSEVA